MSTLQTFLQWLRSSVIPLLALLLVCLALSGSGQQSKKSKEDLLKSKEAIEKEIEFNRKLLAETQKSRKASSAEVAILRSLIAKRERLIGAIDKEIGLLERQIDQNQRSIENLSLKLERLKKEYARLIYHAYRSKASYQRLMFIFAAEDFNQAYQRLRYMQQYGRHRKRQAENIRETQNRLGTQITDLQDARQDKESLLVSQEAEKGKLAREKQAKDLTVNSLSKKEKELKAQIKEKEKAAKSLQRTIDDIISREIAASAQKSTATKPNASSTFALTPEEVQLSNSFAENRGKLPWPTERGVVSSSFGTLPHPEIENVYVQNNGIDIITSAGATARAVFSGTVTAVRSVPKFRNVIIVRHGEYLTVYTNLDEVKVKEGDKVNIKQVLGTIHTDIENSKTELHFEIRKGFTLMDPSEWLARRL
jgi:murein hydrolase activator